MTRPGSVFGLHVAVAAVGVAATLAALFAALGSVTLSAGSPAEGILDACRSLIFPTLDVHSLMVLLGSLAFAVFGLAARSMIRQVRATRRFVASLPVVGERRIAGQDVTIVRTPTVSAFCVGLSRPSVYLAESALEALRPDELAAVVAHEAHHARNRDPLRIFIVRSLSDSLFFLPALRRLTEGYASLAELDADRAAIRRAAGDPRPLAGALAAFDDSPVVGIAPERIDHLCGTRTSWKAPLVPLAITAMVAVALVGVSAFTAAAAATPVSLALLVAHACLLLLAALPFVAGRAALRGWRSRRHQIS